MMGSRQLALIQRARERLKLTDENIARMLHVAGDVRRPEDLTKAGFNLFMDQCTALDFRDPRRPVLSAETRKALVALFDQACLTPFEVSTVLRGRGNVGNVRDLDGAGLLRILVYVEKRDGDVEGFVARRRTVTSKQRALLHVARDKVDIQPETYSFLLQWYGGVNTAGDLDQRGFDLVMAYLRYSGFEDERPARVRGPAFGERPGFASPQQVQLIRELWAEWSGAAEEGALNAWLEHYYHVSSLRFLTFANASKTITALKAMKRRVTGPSKVTA